jgi:geranylgeranyl diphosphate synthase type II
MPSKTISEFDFKEYTTTLRQAIEASLEAYLSGDDPPALWDSMRYSVLNGGKRLRALLCLSTGMAIKGGGTRAVKTLMPCACAIEMVHAMSLIHDDLPCMDNDDLRRGKPTNHKVFGEALALLAGDALLMHAIDILIDKTPRSIDRSIVLSVALELSRATGARGMVGGQVEDLAFTGFSAGRAPQDPRGGSESLSTMSHPTLDADIIESIHRRKTGALIKFSVWSGAKLAGASQAQLHGLDRFGDILGLAFQIADDLLDVTGDASTIGKTPGKDEASKKATWVRIFGITGAQEKLVELEEEGEMLLSGLHLESGSSPALHALLKYAIHRSN